MDSAPGVLQREVTVTKNSELALPTRSPLLGHQRSHFFSRPPSPRHILSSRPGGREGSQHSTSVFLWLPITTALQSVPTRRPLPTSGGFVHPWVGFLSATDEESQPQSHTLFQVTCSLGICPSQVPCRISEATSEQKMEGIEGSISDSSRKVAPNRPQGM